MVYGKRFNIFLKDNKELTNQAKVETLKQYSLEDTLTLLRNIEESPREYDVEVIKGVASCLYDKGVICL